jgi:hypothetical protein
LADFIRITVASGAGGFSADTQSYDVFHPARISSKRVALCLGITKA